MKETPRPYHHGNLREALLHAAEKALEARGAQNISLRELSRDVGVSHTSPRRHFANKQALMDALALLEAGEKAFAHAHAIFREGQAAGEVIPGDPWRLSLVVFASMQGLIAISTNGKFKGIPLDHLVGEIIERLMLGFRPRGN